MNKYHLNFILYLGDSLMPARICKCYGQKLLWLENYFIFTSLCLRFYLAADKEVNKVKARFFFICCVVLNPWKKTEKGHSHMTTGSILVMFINFLKHHFADALPRDCLTFQKIVLNLD